MAEKGDEVPIEGYDELTVEEIVDRLDDLSEGELARVREYERRNRNRGPLMEQITRRVSAEM